MTSTVSDSGPFIHLATVGQFDLLRRFFESVLTIPEVYDEVVTQGQDLPGSQELATACEAGLVRLIATEDAGVIGGLRRAAPPALSDIDIKVLALAVDQQMPLLSDDEPLRAFARTQDVTVSGSIGVLIQARRDGAIPALKPLLDQLIEAGFHLNPRGSVYRDALHEAGEA